MVKWAKKSIWNYWHIMEYVGFMLEMFTIVTWTYISSYVYNVMNNWILGYIVFYQIKNYVMQFEENRLIAVAVSKHGIICPLEIRKKWVFKWKIVKSTQLWENTMKEIRMTTFYSNSPEEIYFSDLFCGKSFKLITFFGTAATKHLLRCQNT